MKNTLLILLTLIIFFTGCKKEEATIEHFDSTSSNNQIVGSSADSSLLLINQKESMGKKENSKISKKEETPSQIISREYAFLRPILESKEDTFSGLAILIDTLNYIPFFGIFLYILLSILGLTMKYIDSNGIRSIVLLQTLSLFFLAISRTFSFKSEILWGYWFAIVLVSVLTILDIYILTKEFKNKVKDSA